MHCGPCLLITVIDGTLMCVESWVVRQQRRVNVHQLSHKGIDEYRRKDAHEAGEHNHIGIVLLDRLCECCVKGLPRLIQFVINNGGGYACVRCGCETGCIRTVTNHPHHLTTQRSLALSFKESLHVGAAPRNENRNPLFGGRTQEVNSTIPLPSAIVPSSQQFKP